MSGKQEEQISTKAVRIKYIFYKLCLTKVPSIFQNCVIPNSYCFKRRFRKHQPVRVNVANPPIAGPSPPFSNSAEQISHIGQSTAQLSMPWHVVRAASLHLPFTLLLITHRRHLPSIVIVLPTILFSLAFDGINSGL